jgi:hypothetical protein
LAAYFDSILKEVDNMSRLHALLLSCLVVTGCLAGEFVPFVTPAKPNPNSLIAVKSIDPIDVKDERLVVRDAHFYCGAARVRLWGVNLSFGANFPRHEDAPYIAARLAAGGVNTVRCHHTDTSNWPRGIWDDKDPTKLSEEALDRLDYFIDQLARHGIFVNINLHVGREHSRYIGLPKVNREYDKISCIFTPAIIDAQKKHARDLLTHVNKYRKVRYADDPAVAIVEITNENSLFMWDSENTLRTLPGYYADILQKKYNGWLKAKYDSDENLRQGWAKGVEPLGANILRNANLQQMDANSNAPRYWSLEQHEGCKASCSQTQYQARNALRIEIVKADGTGWHIQLNQGGLAVEQGKYYTVTFEAAADKPRDISCSVGQAHSPWDNLGLSRQVQLTEKWQRFTFGFVAKEGDDNTRVSFTLGDSDVPLYLANVEFRPGGRTGLADKESVEAGSVRLFGDSESSERTIDRMIFLAETEKRYFDDIRDFIKKDLGCKALVTGTIVFGPLGLYGQSDMDFIDAHAYWQHPRFPGRPWDSANWLVDQKPMADFPEQATLFRLAAERLHGKPFTVSEYNHPAPLDSQAECVPMIASFAAAQDWDGVWLYTYSHSGDNWERDFMYSYFDIDTNPAKWGFMRAGAVIFREAITRSMPGVLVVGLTKSTDVVRDLATLHLTGDRDMLGVAGDVAGVTRQDILERRLYVSLGVPPSVTEQPSASWHLVWSVSEGKGLYLTAGAGAGVLAGHTNRFEQATDGVAAISAPDYAVITATPLDGVSWQDSRKILITACGRCENTGMKFSEDRRTVGREWGKGPAQIEAVEGTLTVPGENWFCQALGPDGTASHDVPVQIRDGRSVVELSPRYKTMWYLFTQK